MELNNSLFIRACHRQPVERTPVWMMRQAGRYLPEYREIRAQHDFLTMCKTPELAATVTIQPVDRLDVDAAILFSDILVIPEAMGMELIMEEKRGPVFPNPIRLRTDAEKLKTIDPSTDLKYVLDAIALTLERLHGRVPLIGFSGSPWTLFTYMVEGKGSKSFSEVKKLIYTNPALAHSILLMIAQAVTAYLNAQIRAGVHAVQIFDTWGGILSKTEFLEFSLPYITHIISKLERTDQPVIVFAKGVHFAIDELAAIHADVLGLDWTMDIGDVRSRIGSSVALQGNLDPTVLYAPHAVIKRETVRILEQFGSHPGHIFNLGHGILPDVPPEHAKFFIDTVKKESARFHSQEGLQNAL